MSELGKATASVSEGDAVELAEETGGVTEVDAAEAAELMEAPEAPEITFDEQFYPARPKALRPVARRRQYFSNAPSLELDGLNKT